MANRTDAGAMGAEPGLSVFRPKADNPARAQSDNVGRRLRSVRRGVFRQRVVEDFRGWRERAHESVRPGTRALGDRDGKLLVPGCRGESLLGVIGCTVSRVRAVEGTSER